MGRTGEEAPWGRSERSRARRFTGAFRLTPGHRVRPGERSVALEWYRTQARRERSATGAKGRNWERGTLSVWRPPPSGGPGDPGPRLGPRPSALVLRSSVDRATVS